MVFRFGDCVLDEDARRVFCRGAEVRLSPKAFELLLILVEAAPKAIAKDALQNRLWPDTFVAEANLANLVSEIRSALADTAREPRVIRTVPRFGYACAVDVVRTGTATTEADCALVSDGREWPLQSGEHVLGRVGGAVPCFESASVSRRHARLVVGDGRALLEDLGSKNGTFVNGARVTAPVPLADGDELRLGSVTVLFRRRGGGDVTQTMRIT